MENIEKHEIKSLKVKTISIILADYFEDVKGSCYFTARSKILSLRLLLKEIKELEAENENKVSQ